MWAPNEEEEDDDDEGDAVMAAAAAAAAEDAPQPVPEAAGDGANEAPQAVPNFAADIAAAVAQAEADMDPLGPVYVIQGFGGVGGNDDDDEDLADGLLANFEPMVQNELQVMFDEVDALHSFYQPLLGLPSGIAALGGKFGRGAGHRCSRPVKSLLRLSMDKYLRTADVAAADAVFANDMPKTLFYDLLHVAMYSRESRTIVIQQLLKHWPEKTLKVAELKKCMQQHQLDVPLPFSPCASEKTLLSAFFSAFGNSERRNLRCLDLRGANERFLDKLEEFQGFYTDHTFKDSECEFYCPEQCSNCCTLML
jgi:hypothetical protein